MTPGIGSDRSTDLPAGIRASTWTQARPTILPHNRDLATTLIYADYQPSARAADLLDDAFRGAEIASAPTGDTRASRG